MRWKPDTCAGTDRCVLEFNGSNALVNLTRVVHLCADHATAADAIQDNLLKNRAVSGVVQALLSRDPTLIAEDVGWRFDGARSMLVTPPARIALSAAQRTTLQTSLTGVDARIVLDL